MAKKSEQILPDAMERAAAVEKAGTHLTSIEQNQGRDGEAAQNFKDTISPHLPEGSTIEAFMYNGKLRLQWRAKPSGKPTEMPPEGGNLPF